MIVHYALIIQLNIWICLLNFEWQQRERKEDNNFENLFLLLFLLFESLSAQKSSIWGFYTQTTVYSIRYRPQVFEFEFQLSTVREERFRNLLGDSNVEAKASIFSEKIWIADCCAEPKLQMMCDIWITKWTVINFNVCIFDSSTHRGFEFLWICWS